MNSRPVETPLLPTANSRTTYANNNQGASTVKPTMSVASRKNKIKLIQIVAYLTCISLSEGLPVFPQGLTQNHTNFAKVLSKSCKKKMPTETCKCYADKIIGRYNEIQILSIYQKMIKSKKNQEMFFLSTSPELLYCMDNKN